MPFECHVLKSFSLFAVPISAREGSGRGLRVLVHRRQDLSEVVRGGEAPDSLLVFFLKFGCV